MKARTILLGLLAVVALPILLVLGILWIVLRMMAGPKRVVLIER